MTRITTDSADLIHARHSEWMDGFKAGALFTTLCSIVGIVIAGWVA